MNIWGIQNSERNRIDDPQHVTQEPLRPSVGLSDKIKHWKIWRKPFGLIEVRTIQIQWTSPVKCTSISKFVSVTNFGYTCWLKL